MKQVSLTLGTNRESNREIITRARRLTDADTFVEGPSVWVGDSRTGGVPAGSGVGGCPDCLPECPDCSPGIPCAGYTDAELSAIADTFTITDNFSELDSVTFDSIPAMEDEHYTVAGKTITPLTTLLAGTIVRARYKIL